MRSLFILTIYGLTGSYDSRPLPYAEAASLYFSLSDQGAVISLSEIRVIPS
jgi:hypothetical protein